MHRYRKYTIARDRLQKEKDLFEIIRMNRVTRILNKMRLKPRQRRANDFTQERTVTDQDSRELAAKRDFSRPA